MLNTHKCLLENASKRMGIFRRPRAAFLGDTPKKLTKGEKRVAPSTPEVSQQPTGQQRPDPTKGWGMAAGE